MLRGHRAIVQQARITASLLHKDYQAEYESGDACVEGVVLPHLFNFCLLLYVELLSS